MIINAGNYNKE